MAEICSLKRQREETQMIVVEEQQKQEDVVCKRQKSYKDIITLLEEEEDLPNEDLSSLISTLQEEISSPSSGSDPVQSESDPIQSGLYEPGSGGEEVMRHLLEASDDELGIPNNNNTSSTSTDDSSFTDVMDGFDALLGGQVDGGDLFLPVGDGLWEFEDHEAANYYEYNNFIPSEIFM